MAKNSLPELLKAAPVGASWFEILAARVESYEKTYGYDDGVDYSGPLGLVSMREAEDTRNVSRLYYIMERYITFDVQRYTGLNMMEFLSMPKDYCEHIFKLCSKEILKRKDMAADIERDFKSI